MINSYKVRVYYSDTDASGIVYHARYLDFAEHARTELLRRILPSLSQGALVKENKLSFVVRSISIDYLKPAFLDDELEVVTVIESVGAVSALIKQEIKRGEEVLTKLSVKLAFISTETGRIEKLPLSLIQALEQIK